MKINRRTFIGGTCIAAAWKAQHPDRPAPRYMEAYEVSEYGRAPTEEDFAILNGTNRN